MRNAQVAVFVLGILSFLLSVFFIGQGLGDTLWRAGAGVMLTDLAFIRLWQVSPTG
jgi:hypothetical protein